MAVMRNAPLLRVLPDDALKLLAFGSEAQNLRPRDPLFEAGDAADGAVLMLGGQLRLLAPGISAPRVVGVGHLIDELALVVPTERSASAVAQTSCEVLSIPRVQMLRILEEFPDAAARMRSTLAQRSAAFLAEVGALADRLARR
jgi:CRP-like cAMP-binding protein